MSEVVDFTAAEYWWPSPELRWVYKDGRYVLQQRWWKRTNGYAEEWRDVPTADETKP